MNTTKKRDYPSVLKSAGIAPKSAGIRSKFLSRRFFPGASDRRFLNVGIGSCGPVLEDSHLEMKKALVFTVNNAYDIAKQFIYIIEVRDLRWQLAKTVMEIFVTK